MRFICVCVTSSVCLRLRLCVVARVMLWLGRPFRFGERCFRSVLVSRNWTTQSFVDFLILPPKSSSKLVWPICMDNSKAFFFAQNQSLWTIFRKFHFENHHISLLFSDNELYSGTVADFSGSDPIIYREPLQTEQYDSLSLNGDNISVERVPLQERWRWNGKRLGYNSPTRMMSMSDCPLPSSSMLPFPLPLMPCRLPGISSESCYLLNVFSVSLQRQTLLVHSLKETLYIFSFVKQPSNT